ncbi:MAG: hypothetical protein H0T47_17955 [Planctomycetaceae bacterium]|nr:hypothetical protein [Planctomycetaceae bacterium]
MDPDFCGISWNERTESIRRILDSGPRELVDRISILVVMTPEEAEEIHVSSVDLDESSSGPVSFRDGELVFREENDSHQIYVTVSRPFLNTLQQAQDYCASIKFDYRPGIIATDDDQLSVDIGETLRNEQHQTRWFETVEQARDAAFEAARRRLARYAAA